MHHGHSTTVATGAILGFLAALFLSLLTAPGVAATSFEAPPFNNVHAPSNPILRLKRGYKPFDKRSLLSSPSDARPRHDDTFLLKFEVDSEPFSVVFRPASTLLHPHAKVHLHTQSGLGRTTHALKAQDVRAYEGTVLHEHNAEDYWAEEVAGLVRPWEKQRGWARLLLRDDEAWDGSMQVDGVRFHFKPVHAYIRDAHQSAKRSGLPPLNPPLPALARRILLGGNTVVLRSLDVTDAAEDSAASAAACSHDRSPFNIQTSHDLAARPLPPPRLDARFLPHFQRDSDHLEWLPPGAHLARRQDIQGGQGNSSFENSIGDTSGCPQEKRVVYIGVAADCNAVSDFGSQDEARTQMLSLINSVSGVYTNTFNVSIGVVELNVKDASCPSSTPSDEPWNVACDGSSAPDLNTRLSLFSQWRGDKGGGDGAGLWHLITTCSSSAEVGVAWLGQLCRVDAGSSGSGGETVSGTAVTSLTDRTWEVIAHEIGHNFGAIHDCSSGCDPTTDTVQGSPCCPLTSGSTCDADSDFIMSPVSRKNTTDFSQCSLGNICSMLSNGLNTTCLEVPGNRETLSTQQCGNGILEPGEECDPGNDSGTTCCTSDCKLTDGSKCDPSNQACCTDQCQYASSSRVCRPSVNDECDPEETCSGDSGDCPEDKHAENGQSCGDDGDDLQCAAGKCTSRDQECKQQGSSMNIKKACSQSTDTCEMTCQNPNGSGCLILGSYFSDGLSCGLAGTCQNGSCNEGSLSDKIGNWISKNKQYSIPIIVVGSIIVLCILYSIIRCCFCGGRKRTRVAPSAAYAIGHRRRSRVVPMGQAPQSQGYQPAPPPRHPSMQQHPPPQYSPVSAPPQSYQPGHVSGSFAPPPGPPPPR